MLARGSALTQTREHSDLYAEATAAFGTCPEIE